ncbi:hypothetical protein [Methylobacterium sp. ID0610]|uniref:hypothetical protein n=1 Tax=Methylobacterium carpenticola TaxID=3344827 RepID=UPI003679E9F6
MRWSLIRSVRGCAAVAWVALYALCLQAVLGAMAPLPQASAGDVICAHGGAPAGSDTTPDPAKACRHACCLAAQADRLLPACAALFVALVWPMPDAAPAGWTLAEARMPRAPPDPALGPRGPPLR